MSTVLRWGWALWRDDLPALLAITGLSVGSAALLTAFPWAWQHAIERLGGSPTELREVTGWLTAIAVAQWLLYMALQGARATMNARIEWRARDRVFDHLTRLDPEVFRRWSTGDLVTRLYDDAGEKISWFLCSGVFRAWEAVLILAACLVAMASIDGWVTLAICAPMPLLLVAQAASQAALGRRFGAVQASISAINDHLTASFEGLRVVQANGLAAAARRGFAERAQAQRSAEIAVARVQQAVQLQYGQGWQLAVLGLLVPGGHAVVAGRISTAEFIALEGLVMTLVWPMFDLGIFVSRLPQAHVALQRLDELLAEPRRATSGSERPARASIAAVAAGVRSEDGAVLLRELAFDAPPGARVALTGPVGSGKSTAMAVLAGLRHPTTGSVTLGDHDLRAVDPAAQRALVAFVPQDPVLLSASIRDNILLGRELEASDLARAVEVSQLANDLERLPGGLDTPVGARGQTLSGGQQQRVAIARALAGSPGILLLDDATAALDADTEAALWAALGRAFGATTTVVVTHRAATLATADHVVHLTPTPAARPPEPENGAG